MVSRRPGYRDFPGVSRAQNRVAGPGDLERESAAEQRTVRDQRLENPFSERSRRPLPRPASLFRAASVDASCCYLGFGSRHEGEQCEAPGAPLVLEAWG